ncbi:hypothetical protein LCGC14_1757580 [marine sediment metagenome]|uniref:Uncharacterized protein n=1 Tax=marine sediment metagenome TaxID=412755 RepID=A0A0F9HPB1_9ZZZZ
MLFFKKVSLNLVSKYVQYHLKSNKETIQHCDDE